MLSGVELSLEGWLLFAGAAGLAGLDAAGWPQAMWSRPLVAATAGGWLLGDAAAGLLVGALLELLVLRHVPLGGARCPDTGPASVAAGAALAAVGPAGPGGVAAAVLAGWAGSWLGAGSVSLVRRAAGRALADAGAMARVPPRVERRHRGMLALDLARGAVLGVLFLVPTVAGVDAVGAVPTGMPAAPALGIAAGAGAGAGARSLATGRSGTWLVVAGAAAGAIVGGWLL
jgi:PTS system mannose-specific IIC component